jgi:phosphoglycerate dehydrogenase-like enzyme
MNSEDKIAVLSRSFSKHKLLRQELLAKYSNVKFNDEGLKLNGRTLIKFLEGATKAITALEVIDNSVISALPKLKVISKYGVGIDMIDKDALEKHNVKLGWTGGVNRRSVSELVISSAISMLRHVPIASEDAIKGNWRQFIGRELSSLTIGIIGCGFIGKDLAKLLSVFGSNVLAYDILDFPEFYKKNNVTPVDISTLLKESDLVTLHLPLDKSTKNILNKERMNLMKKSALLINYSRGGLLDESELKSMLMNGQLAGAALDVFSQEPPEDQELINLPNFIVTPHIGGSSEEAVMAMGRSAIEGLDDCHRAHL